MARIRSIKPSFFTNEDLADLSMAHRLLFIGLWTQADREGLLEDRPRRLKAAIFPFDDVNVETMLADLATAHFITRYVVEGRNCIEVNNFAKHQRPRKDEFPSVLPKKIETTQRRKRHYAVTEPSLRSDRAVAEQSIGDRKIGGRNLKIAERPKGSAPLVQERLIRTPEPARRIKLSYGRGQAPSFAEGLRKQTPGGGDHDQSTDRADDHLRDAGDLSRGAASGNR